MTTILSSPTTTCLECGEPIAETSARFSQTHLACILAAQAEERAAKQARRYTHQRELALTARAYRRPA